MNLNKISLQNILSRLSRSCISLFLLSNIVACEESKDPVVNNTIIEPSFTLDLAQAPADGAGGDSLAVELQKLTLESRESSIYRQISEGNVPEFMRTLIPVSFSETLRDTLYEVTLYVSPDYMSLGSNQDHLLMPMTPILAQKVMDLIGGTLPTRKMVDLIWEAATVKLAPEPIPPSAAMVTVNVFAQHNELVRASRNAQISAHPLGELVAGHKKDVILSNRIADNPAKVVIYGWHYQNGSPIQPLYSGHVNWYADYSHGIRAVLSECVVNERVVSIPDLLQDEVLYRLLSDENQAMRQVKYNTSATSYP